MSSDEKKKIEAVLVIEVLGRPPEYLIETLNEIAKQIGAEPGTKVKNSDIKAPAEMQNQKGFYCSFAEIEVESESMNHLAILVFKYMPAHVEIVSPQNISLSNADWGDVMNEITRRLHGYEEVVRMINAEKIILENKLRELLGKQEGKPEKVEKRKNNVQEGKEKKKSQGRKKKNG